MSNHALNWAWSLPLSSGEKLVLVRYADMANTENECFPKQETVAKDTGLSRSSVSKHTKSLEQKGLIQQIRQRHKDGRMRASRYKLIISTKPCLDLQHGNLPQRKNEQHLVLNQDSINPHIESSNKDICEIASVSSNGVVTVPSSKFISQPEATAAPLSQLEKIRTVTKMKNNDAVCKYVLDVFQHWQKVMGHSKAILDEKRFNVILKAMKNYSIDDLKKAIDGCANTPHNMGKNDSGQRYDGIHLIFKDADQIERFMRNASANGSSEKEKRRREMFAGAI